MWLSEWESRRAPRPPPRCLPLLYGSNMYAFCGQSELLHWMQVELRLDGGTLVMKGSEKHSPSHAGRERTATTAGCKVRAPTNPRKGHVSELAAYSDACAGQSSLSKVLAADCG